MKIVKLFCLFVCLYIYMKIKHRSVECIVHPSIPPMVEAAGGEES
jgi:hypothetical protein